MFSDLLNLKGNRKTEHCSLFERDTNLEEGKTVVIFVPDYESLHSHKAWVLSYERICSQAKQNSFR